MADGPTNESKSTQAPKNQPQEKLWITFFLGMSSSPLPPLSPPAPTPMGAPSTGATATFPLWLACLLTAPNGNLQTKNMLVAETVVQGLNTRWRRAIPHVAQKKKHGGNAVRVCHNAATDKRLHLSLLLTSCLATPQTPREAGTQTCHNIHQVKYTAAVAVEATWESRCWRESKILTRKQAAGLGATRSLDVLACKIVISRAVGRSSGGASGSWVTSTHVPGRSLRASPAVVQPGRTAACTSRTDNGAYLTGNNFQDIAGMHRKIEGGGWFIGGTRERVWAGGYRRGVVRPRAVRLLRLSPLAT